MPSGRPTVCEATSSGKLVAAAPSAQHSGVSQANSTMMRRLPNRSASSAKGSEMMTPSRTMAPAWPRPRSDTPKLSATKVEVWVKSVLAKVADMPAAASSASVRAWRSVSRSGGDHHGLPFPSGRRVRRDRRRAPANSQPNQGMLRRYRVVSVAEASSCTTTSRR